MLSASLTAAASLDGDRMSSTIGPAAVEHVGLHYTHDDVPAFLSEQRNGKQDIEKLTVAFLKSVEERRPADNAKAA